ncbi:hypothetical protein PybrP1_005067 [[Pythium] brassicae (nom. inval.)]|nr:hypothetical protein PybrP1_005067 [[Pythium] brassicae (nom. inval.)]
MLAPTLAVMRANQGAIAVWRMTSSNVASPATERTTPKTERSAKLGSLPPRKSRSPTASMYAPSAAYSASRSSSTAYFFLSFLAMKNMATAPAYLDMYRSVAENLPSVRQ